MISTQTARTAVFSNSALSFSYDLAAGRFSLSRPGAEYPAIVNTECWVECAAASGKRVRIGGAPARFIDARAIQDVHGAGTEYAFSISTPPGFELTQLVHAFDVRPFLLTRLVLKNTGRDPFFVRDLILAACENENGGNFRLDGTVHALDVFKVGWHGWAYTGLRHAGEKEPGTRLDRFVGKMLFNPATSVSHTRGKFSSDGWTIIGGAETAVVTGLVSTADQFGRIDIDARPDSAGFWLAAQADGIRLDPGETIESEWGFLQFVDLPHPDPAEEYVLAVARQMHARVPAAAPPPKWTHWYHYFQDITHQLFVDNLVTVGNLRQTVPFGTVQLDDGYQVAWGDWDTCNDKFPNGLGHLSSFVRQRGFEAGLWLAPFVVDPRSRVAHDHPDWLLCDQRGKPIQSGYFWSFYGHALDTTRAEVIDHLRNLAHTLAQDWGFNFIKADFTYAAALPAVRHDLKATRAQALRRGFEAIRQGIGEETFLLGSGCPFGPAIGVVDAMRVGPDTAPSYLPSIWNMKLAGPLIRQERSIASLRNNMRHSLNLSTVHRRWWWSDPDCLMVRNYDTRLTPAEIQSSLTIAGLLGGLVISSDDLTRLSDDRAALIALLTPILSPGARPLDLLEREMPELYDLAADSPAGSYHAAAVFNWKDSPANRVLKLARLGLTPGRTLHLFDFWNRTYRQIAEPEVALENIPPHGCRLLRILPADGRPALVGDTLHITSGLEVDAWQIRDDRLELSVGDLGRRVRGELWFWLPRAPGEANIDGEALALRPAGEKVWAAAIDRQGPFSIVVAW